MPAMPRRGAAAPAVGPPHSSTRHETGQDDISRDVFRRHFESLFAPLPLQLSRPGPGSDAVQGESVSQEDSEVDVDIDFEGLSDADDDEDDDNPVVEVVDHSGPGPGAASDPREGIMTKEALKSFMSSRPPPTTGSTPRPLATIAKSSSTLPEDSADLIAKDVELQRLLAESHLLLRHQTDHPILSSSSSGTGAAAAAGSALFASGRARLRATDMRLGALGASGSSLYARPRTARPVALALVAAGAAREKKRRREAREAGVVLERKGGKTGPGAKMAKRRKKGGR